MLVTVIKNLHQMQKKELVRFLLEDSIGFFDELSGNNEERGRDAKKMAHLLIVFKKIYKDICEEYEDACILLKKIFEVVPFQEAITKYLSYLNEMGKKLNEAHCHALQGLWYYFQNLDKVLRYDNCEVGFYLQGAYLQFEMVRTKLHDFRIFEPNSRECQRPIEDDFSNLKLSQSGDESSDIEEATSSPAINPTLIDNFREIPILPSYDDIHRKHVPFIRPNLTDKSYKNIDHYLDTQFRLLREDFVRPLHTSVQKFVKADGDPETTRKDPDLLIYHDVEFIGSEIVPLGLIFIVKFDVERLGKVDWLETSRLLPGSLLCLSADKFETLFFATVAERDPIDVKAGIFCVRIESNSFDFYSLLCGETFVAIESTGYFEAYRHSLKALQDFNSAYSFPLKQYVVDVALDVKRPAYLKGDERYNLTDLAWPIRKSSIQFEESGQGYRFMRSQQLDSINLFKKGAFPWDLMDLDISQFEAFYAALTKEFAVIQGPPGTGKSYIGLRIVQALLKNKKFWNKTEDKDSSTCPILVLSYKNHALDQFLEGALNFTKNIIRVGGRSESKRLKNCMLSEKRKTFNYSSLPMALNKQYKTNVWELKEKITEIDGLGAGIKKITDGVHLLGRELVQYFTQSRHGQQIRAHGDQTAEDVYKSGFIKWMGCDKFISDDEDLVGVVIRAKELLKFMDSKERLYVAMKEANQARGAANGHSEEEDFDDTASEVSEFNVDELKERSSKGTNVRGQTLMAMRLMDSDEYDRAEEYKGEVMGKNMFKKLVSNEQLSKMISDSRIPKVDKGKLKVVRFFRKLFSQSSDVIQMTDEEAMRVDDLNALNSEARFRMFQYWVRKYLDGKKAEMDLQSAKVDLLHQALELLATKKNYAICKDCDVIGMTTTGASKYRKLVEMLAPKVVMIEEAAEILEPYLISALTHKTQHVILIGDHKQLRPIAGVHELSVKYNLEISLFERMVNNNMAFYQLINQHRMRPDISRLLVPHIYKKLNDHPDVKKYPNVVAMRKQNVHFFTHEEPESHYMGHSYCNKDECDFVVELVRYFMLRGIDPAKITLLATYLGQLTMIKKKMMYGGDRDFFVKKRQFKDGKLMPIDFKLTVASVDSFQGQENDIVIISFVRSSQNKDIGFLSTSNRVCVALSRARHGLYCVGNFEQYARKSELWEGITKTLREKNSIGPEITVGCDCMPVTISTTESLRKANDMLKSQKCRCNNY